MTQHFIWFPSFVIASPIHSREESVQQFFVAHLVGLSFGLRVNLKSETTACVSHQFLDHLHVFTIRNQRRGIGMPFLMPGTSCRRSNLLGQHYIRPEWVAYLCGADLRTPNRRVRYRVSLLSTSTTRQRRSEIGEAVGGK